MTGHLLAGRCFARVTAHIMGPMEIHIILDRLEPPDGRLRVMGTLAPVPGIRGRATETWILGEALDRVASGRPAVVLIEGEAGIGKTRLLDEALADTRSRDMQVAAGRAEELEQTRPFGLVTGAFGCAWASLDPRRAAIGERIGLRPHLAPSPRSGPRTRTGRGPGWPGGPTTCGTPPCRYG